MMISPDLTLAPDSNSESVCIGYDIAGKYYTLTKHETIIRQNEVHIEASKRIILTIEQAEKLKNDLNNFFNIHKKY